MKKNGLTLVELLIATAVGGLIIITAYTLYNSHIRQQIAQNNTQICNRTASFVMVYLRNTIISAGGGLPEGVSGLQGDTTPYVSLKAIINQQGIGANVNSAANTDLNDSIIPIDTSLIFVNYSHVYITGTSPGTFKILSLNTAANTIKVMANEIVVGPLKLFPVEVTHLFKHNDTLKINHEIDNSISTGDPVAIGISNLLLQYDIDGSGVYVNTLPSFSSITRVRIGVDCQVRLGNVPSITRSLESLVAIRRGKL